MVAVRMRAADREDRRLADGAQQCRQMVGLVGAWIDDDNAIAVTNQIGLRAGKGKMAGIAGQNARHAWFKLFDGAGGPGLGG